MAYVAHSKKNQININCNELIANFHHFFLVQQKSHTLNKVMEKKLYLNADEEIDI